MGEALHKQEAASSESDAATSPGAAPEATPETPAEEVAQIAGMVFSAGDKAKTAQPIVSASPVALADEFPSRPNHGGSIPGTPAAISMAKEKLRMSLKVAVEKPQGVPAGAAPGGTLSVKPPSGSRIVADVASREAGGRIFMVSSLDDAHPADNVIDGNEQTYWLSTGLYPQEIILELGRPSRVAGVQLLATNVRTFRVEGCSEQPALSFEPLATGELEACAGLLQRQELRCIEQALPTLFLRAKILSGWHDFCSVHRIVVME